MPGIWSRTRVRLGARPTFFATLMVVASLLAACCEGDTLAPSPDIGSVSIDLTNGPASHLDRVWVTIKEVWFHHSDSATAGEGKWEKFPLAMAVTLDVNTLSNGTFAEAFSGIPLPVGTYKQIRLFLALPADPLTPAAKAAGLTYNDQINYTDAKGTKQLAPLEIASAARGIGLNRVFEIVKGKTLHLALEFNVGDDVVRLSHHGADAFELQANLRCFDLDNAAVAAGKIGTGLPAVSDRGAIVNAIALDRVLRENGAYTIASLPSGSRSGLKTNPLTGLADLRGVSSARLNVTLP